MVRVSFDVLDFELIIDKYLTLKIPLEGWTKVQVNQLLNNKVPINQE